MGKFYREAAGDPTRLPWHHTEPSKMLDAAVDDRGRTGRVLDVGCGSGALSVWLAERGLEVTGIDVIPEAIEMAQALAKSRGIHVRFEAADVFGYEPPRPFDVVYDSGCLHSLVGGDVATYKHRVLSWLSDEGSFVLEHWGKRHALDWRPIGPRRRSEATIRRLFAPELRPVEMEVAEFAAPLPFGPKVRGVAYWFRRSGVGVKPSPEPSADHHRSTPDGEGSSTSRESATSIRGASS